MSPGGERAQRGFTSDEFDRSRFADTRHQRPSLVSVECGVAFVR
jgi:hypothetical protein